MSLHAFSRGVFDGILQGDDGNDRMTFNLFNPFVVPLDRVFVANALLDGGAGLDTKIAATPNVTVLSCELPLYVAPPVGGGVLSPS